MVNVVNQLNLGKVHIPAQLTQFAQDFLLGISAKCPMPCPAVELQHRMANLQEIEKVVGVHQVVSLPPLFMQSVD